MADAAINPMQLDFSKKIEKRVKKDENNNSFVEVDKWDKNNKDSLDCASKIIFNCYDTSLYSDKGEAIWNKMAELNELDSDYTKAMFEPESKLILPESIEFEEEVIEKQEEPEEKVEEEQHNTLNIILSDKITDKLKTDDKGNKFVEVDNWSKDGENNIDCASRILDNCYNTNLYSPKGKVIWNKLAELNGLDSDFTKAMFTPEQKLILAESIEIGEIKITDLENEVTQSDVYDLEGNIIQTTYSNKDGGELTPVFDSWAQDYKVESKDPFKATATIDDMAATITKENGYTNVAFELGANGITYKDGDMEVKSTQKIRTYNSQGSHLQTIHKNEQGEDVFCIDMEYDADGKTLLKETQKTTKEGVMLKNGDNYFEKIEIENSVTGKVLSKVGYLNDEKYTYDQETKKWNKAETQE